MGNSPQHAKGAPAHDWPHLDGLLFFRTLRTASQTFSRFVWLTILLNEGPAKSQCADQRAQNTEDRIKEQLYWNHH